MYTIKYSHWLFVLALTALMGSCKKLVEIDAPVDTVTTSQAFAGNKEADWAVSALYSKMINGFTANLITLTAEKNFSAGLCTILGGLASDELRSQLDDETYLFFNTNKLTVFRAGASIDLWGSAYKAIFDANAIIEGIAASESEYLTDSTRRQLTGEALAIRSFAYFNLVNFFGDLPMPLTTDFNKTARLTRTPVAKVYEQILADLRQAIPLLQTDYTAGKSERVRINRWFAEALLARACLFAGDYQGAITSATNVIGQTLFYQLDDPSNAFLSTSKEAILQLKQNNISMLGNATPEGYVVAVRFRLNEQLVNSFEAGDKRKAAWIKQSDDIFLPAKYKIGSTNPYDSPLEYYVVMRLPELYLIRAEARMLLSSSNTTDAIDDLNKLRERANATLLPTDLSAEEVTAAIAKERQLELFAEWGHRWFDLKRTGKASEVLSVLSYKMPWDGDHQLLYPIPLNDIRDNNNLKQNPGYTNL
ncbi:RagB/SusD family nutrient uptake outer membrane protein [Pseudobacter ginsenosidimutans]|jgi:hypothetical protein|uniref:SusD-like starch-binding protein associating with outer membrane n=1 Tax=Pseudobacter ginsenosidimutans TaxID=661488 RepID=A0A4Q7MZ36_9BACT|nr:RagB/SusD family nutrient uptake outer membrane protein [Pseudobacter ginsenosidimutans]QEC43163.1 RagB/SusD family nutrient uptake outer membrane protein [Pseudobacter ginsenosidimutans]RZS74521.1 SusD-like starch-binding protein associating with outer membrane [Pseudobacter ginsenosidimutans]